MNIEKLQKLRACEGACDYLQSKADWQTAVKDCDRLDWLEWLIYRIGGDIQAEYEKIKGAARAEYWKIEGASWAEYEKIQAAARAEY